MPAKKLRKRRRDFKCLNHPVKANSRKCHRCNDNLPMQPQNRQAHFDLCAEIIDATYSEAEEEGDAVFVDDETVKQEE
jgi:hypothetical protein